MLHAEEEEVNEALIVFLIGLSPSSLQHTHTQSLHVQLSLSDRERQGERESERDGERERERDGERKKERKKERGEERRGEREEWRAQQRQSGRDSVLR